MVAQAQWRGDLRLWDYLGPDEEQSLGGSPEPDSENPPQPQEGAPEPGDGAPGESEGDFEDGGGEDESEDDATGGPEGDEDDASEGDDQPGPAPGSIEGGRDSATAEERWASTIIRSPGLTYRAFESWDSFCECVADESLARWSHRSSHSKSGESGWAGTSTFDKAIEMATTTGWPEGRELMSESLALVAPRPEYYSSMSFDVAGAYPMVPLYCAGEPECMVDFGADLRQSKPVVRIDYTCSALGYISPKEMMLKGAAVLSLCDQLEARGHSVELRIVSNWDNSSGSTNHQFHYSVVFKRAGQPWDLDRAAFACANPATMRRLGFALVEQHSELERGFGSGYGRTNNRPIADSTSPNTIFIPGARSGETAESAAKAVAQAAKDFLGEENA